jgi:FAD/FMN-containing dehydrogenase
METMEIAAERARSAWHDLQSNGMAGKIAVPGEAAYERARKIWNGAVTARPALFVLCETNQDVQVTIGVARRHALPLSVRCGGHDFAGRALRHDGIVIDLSRMRQVEVDPVERVAVVAGGATSKDVALATVPHGLIAATANVGAVGMGGLTLGGGYSPMSSQFGLLCDNLLQATVVLADGTLVTANASENPDLFWALRGGGGNFGVVTSMSFRLHPVRELLAGVMLFPWAEAEQVLRGYADLAASLPEELGVTCGMIPAPNGALTVFIAPNWQGDRKQGEGIIGNLRSLGTPIVDQVGWMTYDVMLDRFDASVVNGRHYDASTRWFHHLTPDVIAASVAGMDQATSPLSLIAWHHFRGAPTRIPPDATAFGLRQEHFMMDILAAWEPASRKEGNVHRQWMRDFSESLAPFALPGGYPNMLSPEDRAQIPFAYGGNAPRLLAIKKRYDADGVFTSAVPLPAEAAMAGNAYQGDQL